MQLKQAIFRLGTSITAKTSPPAAAGNYDVKVIFEGDGNYAATSKYFTMVISPRPIKVMADAKNPFYGDSASLTYTYDKTDLLGNQFTGSLTRETGDDIGAYGILQGTLQLSNHVITFVSASYVINPRTLTIRVIDDQKQYGDDNPTFDYASEGLMGGDLITGEAAYRTSAEKFSSVAAYAVSVSGLTAGKNYTIKYADGTLTVIKRDVNIVFGANTFVYDGTEKHIDASLTGLVNADTVIIYFDKTVISAGDYSVRASIVSDNYNLIGSVTATVKVEKAEQVISVEKTTFGYDGNAHSIVPRLRRVTAQSVI